jgi:hypothetical protein
MAARAEPKGRDDIFSAAFVAANAHLLTPLLSKTCFVFCQLEIIQLSGRFSCHLKVPLVFNYSASRSH